MSASAVAKASARSAAAQSVASVLSGTSLDEALAAALVGLAAEEHALVRAIAYGVLRERRLLEWLLSQLLDRPLKPEPELQALLLCGLQQLRAMRIPPHAAVAETVGATAAIGKSWARGFVNAVLRRYQRDQAKLEAAPPANIAIRYSYPDWLATAIARDWPGSSEAVLAAGNEQGPLSLRVNRLQGSREDYLHALETAGIAARPVEGLADALRLETAVAVDRLPGFEHGRVSVQDAAAQLAAALLDAQPGMRVLDACAAPGGKAAQILERSDGLDLLALDVDAQRLARVRETLDRLKLGLGSMERGWTPAASDADAQLANPPPSRVRLRCADALATESWWDGQPFDRILLDAPCSGTGVIRRHPDIKWLRRATDIAAMAQRQLALLEALWPLLAAKGVLVYATCSILKAEGEDVVAAFLARHPEASAAPIVAAWGEPCALGRRIAPGGDYDGFYYAKLCKA